jgi:hypothetical protein
VLLTDHLRQDLRGDPTGEDWGTLTRSQNLSFVRGELDCSYRYDECAVYFGSIEGHGVDAACRATEGKASM